jgi:DNA-binding transcriptional LysR family regulator
MLEDIHALVQFAETGSVVRAAERLHRTPSAVTRQVQRLEAVLGTALLDRSVKPPRLTPLGVRVLEHSRELLRHVAELKAIAAPDSEPAGLLRIGVSHALADGALVDPVRALTQRFPKIRLRLVSELTGDLFTKLQSGELDMAAVLLPEGRRALAPLTTEIVATDRMLIVASSSHRQKSKVAWRDLSSTPWVLNPPGCLLRAALLDAMATAGVSATVAAEIHNMHLQLAFVQAGYGLGLLPERFVRNYSGEATLSVIKPAGFNLKMTIAIARSGPLGSLEAAANCFRDAVSELSRQPSGAAFIRDRGRGGKTKDSPHPSQGRPGSRNRPP